MSAAANRARRCPRPDQFAGPYPSPDLRDDSSACSRSKPSVHPASWSARRPSVANPDWARTRSVASPRSRNDKSTTVTRSSGSGSSHRNVYTRRAGGSIAWNSPERWNSSPSGGCIPNRYSPPTRRSRSISGVVNPRGPHHRARSSGSIHALKTTSRGAGSSRCNRNVSPLESAIDPPRRSPGLLDDGSAVDGERVPDDERGRVAAQPHDGLRDLFRTAQPPERHRSGHHALDLLVAAHEPLEHRRARAPGADRVDAQTLRRVLQ